MGLMCLVRARAHFNLDTNLGAHYEADDLETGRTIARPTDRRRQRGGRATGWAAATADGLPRGCKATRPPGEVQYWA